jgi:carboxypeptidase PM20D1
VLDEGGAIVKGTVPGIEGKVAVVGIAEKGSVTVELIARAAGGHSSSPPPHTAIGTLSTAIHELERNQMPKELRGAALSFFDYVGPEMPLHYRIAVGNLWLFGGMLEDVLERTSPATNATLRTTTAATVIDGGVKSNVLPTDARALVNFRILPGDTAEDVVAHVKRVVGDLGIEVRALPDSREPSEVSPIDDDAFVLLQKTIRQVFPDTLVTPYLTVGGTDSRYFVNLTPNIYKFTPIIADASDLTRMHGTNERMAVDNYVQVVQFFVQLIRNSQTPA